MVRVIQRRSGFQKFKGFVWSPEMGATIVSAIVLVAIPITLFQASRQQDIRQRAAGGVARTASINVIPTSGSYGVGQQFTVVLGLNGGGQAFNAASATIQTSNNLSVQSIYITSPFSGGCNFTFTDIASTPTVTNPSFNGILPNGSSNGCSLYTLALKAIGPGPASISITNASVKSFAESGSEILESVTNASFNISNTR